MDIRINQTPLFNRLNGVDRTKRVNPAEQKEPEQDTQKFSDQLKMARKKKEEKNQQNQEEQKEGREAEASDDQARPRPDEEQSSPKSPDEKTQDENDVGTNIDIKV